MSKKRKIILGVTVMTIALLVSVVAFLVYDDKHRNCQDIIGDGYAMGTDPEPVVIGNTCGPDYVHY